MSYSFITRWTRSRRRRWRRRWRKWRPEEKQGNRGYSWLKARKEEELGREKAQRNIGMIDPGWAFRFRSFGWLPARVTRCPLHLHCTYKGCEPRARTSEKTAYAYDNGGACLRAILMGLGEAIQYFSNPVIPHLSGRQVASEYKVASHRASYLSLSPCTPRLKGCWGTASKGMPVYLVDMWRFIEYCYEDAPIVSLKWRWNSDTASTESSVTLRFFYKEPWKDTFLHFAVLVDSVTPSNPLQNWETWGNCENVTISPPREDRSTSNFCSLDDWTNHEGRVSKKFILIHVKERSLLNKKESLINISQMSILEEFAPVCHI